MFSSGAESDLLVEARSTLLDALDALAEHRHAVIVIGAQAIYLHTGEAQVALAEATKDSDLALDARSLGSDPLIEEAMRQADFMPNPNGQPGSWINERGIPVDLMVPEAIAGTGGRRSVRVPPHDSRAMRRAVGLEAVVVDHAPMEIQSLAQEDLRSFTANVAGPGALLVAKLHKIGDREDDPARLIDKDAHDIYRLLVAIPTDVLGIALQALLANALAGDVTAEALHFLRALFAAGPTALGSVMTGRAEQGIGDPDVVAASCVALASELLEAVAAT
jgi:hypothetical protein